ncbi:hypothetical protein SCHPADRAFT_891983 [Schizopora paradoxa]|uniref:Uncharacterized protein n=1 Tax=Schizopora paradoxa TaxID=27342 RepID=A0A0H2RGF3_9AGAM|nr:hypothetical protein SCHPADRAFT_891983 [Schizopora paradoxa]
MDCYSAPQRLRAGLTSPARIASESRGLNELETAEQSSGRAHSVYRSSTLMSDKELDIKRMFAPHAHAQYRSRPATNRKINFEAHDLHHLRRRRYRLTRQFKGPLILGFDPPLRLQTEARKDETKEGGKCKLPSAESEIHQTSKRKDGPAASAFALPINVPYGRRPFRTRGYDLRDGGVLTVYDPTLFFGVESNTYISALLSATVLVTQSCRANSTPDIKPQRSRWTSPPSPPSPARTNNNHECHLSLHYDLNHVSSNNFSLQIPTFDQKHHQTNRSNTFSKPPSLLLLRMYYSWRSGLSTSLQHPTSTHDPYRREARTTRTKEGTKQHLSHLSIASIFIRLHLQVRERDLGKPRRAPERRCCLSLVFSASSRKALGRRGAEAQTGFEIMFKCSRDGWGIKNKVRNGPPWAWSFRMILLYSTFSIRHQHVYHESPTSYIDVTQAEVFAADRRSVTNKRIALLADPSAKKSSTEERPQHCRCYCYHWQELGKPGNDLLALDTLRLMVRYDGFHSDRKRALYDEDSALKAGFRVVTLGSDDGMNIADGDADRQSSPSLISPNSQISRRSLPTVYECRASSSPRFDVRTEAVMDIKISGLYSRVEHALFLASPIPRHHHRRDNRQGDVREASGNQTIAYHDCCPRQLA